MRVLGIDPGTKPGFAIFDGEELAKVVSYDFARMVQMHGPVGRWLGFQMLLDELGGDVQRIGFEDVHWHTGVDAAHIYGAWKALVQLWCFGNNVELRMIAVGTGKRALTGRGDASHESMRNTLRRRFGVEDRTKAADLAHAVGIALAAMR